jgi:hypothetical protein
MSRSLNGWHRIWIVGSAILLIVMAWDGYLAVAIADDTARLGIVRDFVVSYLLWVVGVLVAGYAIAWIRRGFRATT